MSCLRSTASALLAVSSSLVLVTAVAAPATAAVGVPAGTTPASVGLELPAEARAAVPVLCLEPRQAGASSTVVTTPRLCLP
jgi:hypothetical protein